MDRTRIKPLSPQRTYEISEEESLRPLRSILLLEDDDEYAQMLKEFLQMQGFNVTVAADGVQGMKRILERDYDVVICDLLMPNLPGDMFYIGVERVKPALAKRFVFITGYQDNAKVSQFLKKIRALTLFKPFELSVLLDMVQLALKNRRPGTQGGGG